MAVIIVPMNVMTDNQEDSRLIERIYEYEQVSKSGDKIICEFDYEKDNYEIWLNGTEVNDSYRRKGYGTKMIRFYAKK